MFRPCLLAAPSLAALCLAAPAFAEEPATLPREAALQFLANNSGQVLFDEARPGQVRRIQFGCKACTQEALAQLPAIPELRELSLRLDGRVTAADLAAFERMSRLETLTFHHTSLGDRRLQFLAGLPALRRLSLVRLSGFSDDDLAVVATLPKLESLSLSGMALSARGLERLSSLTDLEELWLTSMELTGPVDATLSRLTRLKTLGLIQSRVDPQVIRRLQAALPETRITP